MRRRSFLKLAGAALGGSQVAGAFGGAWDWPATMERVAGSRPRPTPAQLAWQRDERAMFVHFGVNTFTDREWGDGREDPAIFAPTRLDARQWARAARAGGFRAMILTAKHHDGFCLWPTATTEHSVARSPWRGGQGDVVREFVDGCRAEGLRPGLYLSPWDRNNPAYGDSHRYNDLYAAQLTELLTRYGPLAEVWFDGANGEGPNGRRQSYDWPRFFGLVRRYQPDAVIFSDAGPDVRWCGNEAGKAGDPNWSTVNPSSVPYPGATGPGISGALQHGDPDGVAWRPAEADVSIRPGWFYHPAEDGRVRSVDDLEALYFSSVGRNAKLLLNVPPTREGVLHEIDVSRLAGLQTRLTSLFDRDLATGARRAWRVTGDRAARLELDLGRQVTASISRLEEHITQGQRVARYWLSVLQPERGWQRTAVGTTIGYTRLDRFAPVSFRHARLELEYVSRPAGPPVVRLNAGDREA